MAITSTTIIARRLSYAYALLALAAILPLALAVFPHCALLQSCQSNDSTSICGRSGTCNPDNDSECCERTGSATPPSRAPRPSSPAGGGTRTTLTLNSFADGGDGGGASSCTGTFFDDDEKVVALSITWSDA